MCLTGKLDEQEEDAVKKRQEATELLEKLLAEQRAGFERELVELTDNVGARAEQQHDLEGKLQHTTKELERLQKVSRAESRAERRARSRAGNQGERLFSRSHAVFAHTLTHYTLCACLLACLRLPIFSCAY